MLVDDSSDPGVGTPPLLCPFMPTSIGAAAAAVRPRTEGQRGMTVKVGVIGVGMIGQDHIRRLTKVLAGGAVVAVDATSIRTARRPSPTASRVRGRTRPARS